MSQEPERPIEKQLRAAAEKREAEAGGPFELHPATRGLLQGEVKRRYPQGGRRGWLAGWRSLMGPRLAWAASAAAILVLAVLLLPGLRRGAESEMQMARTKHGAESADEARRALGGPQPTDPGNRQDAELDLRPDALERSRMVAQAPTKQEIPTAPEPAREAVPATATAVPLAAAAAPQRPAPTAPAVAAAPAPASSPVPAEAETLSLASSAVLTNALVAARQSEAERVRMEVAAAKDSLTVAGVGGGTASVLAESASSTGFGNYAAAPPPAGVPQSVGTLSGDGFTRRYGLARAPSGVTTPLPTLEASNARLFDTAAAGAVSRFTQTAANQTQWFANVFDKSKASTTAKSGSAVLVSFQVMQAGDKLEVVDHDGSIYRGALPTPAVVDKVQNIQGAYFKVAGTNRSLKQRLEFTGNFLPVANQAQNQALPAAEAAKKILTDQAQNQAAPWLNSSIVGRAKLADGQELQIQANPVVK